jgi:hypothetical protein
MQNKQHQNGKAGKQRNEGEVVPLLLATNAPHDMSKGDEQNGKESKRWDVISKGAILTVTVILNASGSLY